MCPPISCMFVCVCMYMRYRVLPFYNFLFLCHPSPHTQPPRPKDLPHTHFTHPDSRSHFGADQKLGNKFWVDRKEATGDGRRASSLDVDASTSNLIIILCNKPHRFPTVDAHKTQVQDATTLDSESTISPMCANSRHIQRSTNDGYTSPSFDTYKTI